MKPLAHRTALVLFTLILTSTLARAAVSVPPIFSDHMVLQRSRACPVWGKAAPGETVAVKLGDQGTIARADGDGNWMAKLPASEAKEPATLTITGADKKTITINDVLIGDVWDASGQSNMEWPVKASNNAAKEIESADHPWIRFFRFPKSVSTQPTKEFNHGGKWEVCTPETAGGFSAVGYFFARELNQSEKVPIGIIDNSWGGMPAEAFTSAEALAADPDLAPLLEIKRHAIADKDAKAKHEKALAEWQEKNLVKDPGNKGLEKGWAKLDFDDSSWKTMEEPVKWESQGQKIDGAVWFRRTIDIPAEWEGKDLALNLGLLDDFDTTYFNGEQIGAIGPENKLAWAAERKYKVPGKLVKSGKATIATRIFDQWGDGGFSGPPASMKIALASDSAKQSIPLTGPWRYEIEYAKPAPEPLPWPPAAPPSATSPNMASNLFNGMVNPVIPYAIKGVIWYQGESNADRGEQYRKLFPAMIADWRKQWASAGGVESSQQDFPFLFVQLANFSNFKPKPSDPANSGWAELREAQTMTLKTSPNTAMAVIIDIGDSGDIHPKNKQDVGKRLALAAQKLAYGKDVECCGPMYDSMKVEGDKIRIKLTHASGLTAKNGAPKGFQIAGDDKQWHWADAKIEGEDVLVSSKDVVQPAAVRYGWQDDPIVNLYNSAGLPASPFRTDDWPISSAGVLVPGGKPKK